MLDATIAISSPIGPFESLCYSSIMSLCPVQQKEFYLVTSVCIESGRRPGTNSNVISSLIWWGRKFRFVIFILTPKLQWYHANAIQNDFRHSTIPTTYKYSISNRGKKRYYAHHKRKHDITKQRCCHLNGTSRKQHGRGKRVHNTLGRLLTDTYWTEMQEKWIQIK